MLCAPRPGPQSREARSRPWGAGAWSQAGVWGSLSTGPSRRAGCGRSVNRECLSLPPGLLVSFLSAQSSWGCAMKPGAWVAVLVPLRGRQEAELGLAPRNNRCQAALRALWASVSSVGLHSGTRWPRWLQGRLAMDPSQRWGVCRARGGAVCGLCVLALVGCAGGGLLGRGGARDAPGSFVGPHLAGRGMGGRCPPPGVPVQATGIPAARLPALVFDLTVWDALRPSSGAASQTHT